MIKLFLMHHHKLNYFKYVRLKNRFFSRECMQTLPDLRFKIKWHCDSDFIPFLSKLAPHDTISVFKSQALNAMRIDFNHSGITQDTSLSKGSTGRRAMSLLFIDKCVKLLDHKSKTVSFDLYDLLINTQESFDG
jgi:hypothetical protein